MSIYAFNREDIFTICRKGMAFNGRNIKCLVPGQLPVIKIGKAMVSSDIRCLLAYYMQACIEQVQPDHLYLSWNFDQNTTAETNL